MRVRQSRGMRRSEEMGGGMGVGYRREAGGVRRGGVEAVQVRMKVRCHMAGGNGSR